MNKNILNNMIMLIFMLFTNDCDSQKNDIPKINRKPTVAGQFYSANAETLKSNLKELFASAKPKVTKNTLAIISPHAGYVFSGSVAAGSFNQIDADKKYERIFVIGSSHVALLNGASIYNKGDYLTPLGNVKVDLPLANELINKYNFFKYDSVADSREHSLEVQLPFLQYIMKKDYKIVPIIIGTQSPKICKKIAEALKPYFNSKNLFIISTDFSHYPDYNNANIYDKKTIDAILTNSSENFLKVLEENEQKNIPNLATSICGWTSVLTLLYLTDNNKDYIYKSIDYKNSGDSKYGEKDRVVGYSAISVSSAKTESSEFELTDEEQQQLLKIARTTIEQYIKSNKIPEIDSKTITNNLLVHCGAFVTLHKNGNLRGCIGRFGASEPLYKVIQSMAIASATQDSRFSKVTEDEISKIDIEISVLTPMKKINSIDEIVLGKHGIYIKKGYYGGTFLPQVATETGWSLEEFLGHCSRDKAGLGWEGWKDAEVYIYEAKVFHEKR